MQAKKLKSGYTYTSVLMIEQKDTNYSEISQQ